MKTSTPWLLAASLITAAPAMASMNLALDKGCLSCHGQPPRGNLPTIERLAQKAERLRGQDDKIREEAAELRQPRPMGKVVAHENLTTEEAERLVRWLSEGGK